MATALDMQDVGWYCPVLCPRQGGVVGRPVELTIRVVMTHDGG